MTIVQTATGPIDSAALGFTLMHEHVLAMSWAMRSVIPNWFDRDATIREAVAEARSARERGVDAVVDLTPINLGRDVHIIREVAERAELAIVVATGLYHTEELWENGWEADQLVEVLLPEIRDGIQGTSIRAGIIKCATDHLGVTPVNRKLLQMSARLHRATGVPISTHTHAAARTGAAQQDVFAEESVDLSRVVIGHCDDSDDVDYLGGLMKRGSFIGFDRFGIERTRSTQQKVDMVARLCQMGYARQIVLSHDACCAIDLFPGGTVKSGVLKRMPNWHWRYIPDVVLPMLRDSGVSEADIQAMTVDNPRQVFERNTGSY